MLLRTTEMSGFSLALESKFLRKNETFFDNVQVDCTRKSPGGVLCSETQFERSRFCNLLVKFTKCDVQLLKFVEKLVFFGPHTQLLSELGDDQERSPALDLLAFQNVTENVISDV